MFAVLEDVCCAREFLLCLECVLDIFAVVRGGGRHQGDERLLPALADPVEDGRVADDDGHAGQHEPEKEKELLGRAPLPVPERRTAGLTLRGRGVTA
jgi:hypothetical protein